MHIVWYAGHCKIIDLDLHYNDITIPNFLYVSYMWPSNVIQLQPGQEISVEFRRTVRKSFLRNSAEFPKRIRMIFPYIPAEFPHISTEW